VAVGGVVAGEDEEALEIRHAEARMTKPE
jgi:hypothetical protein